MLALRWHPDRNPHDPVAAERFREALEAYENLIDPSRRGRYDQVRRHKGSRTRRSQLSVSLGRIPVDFPVTGHSRRLENPRESNRII